MLNLRYWFLIKPSGPATIIAPTGVGALDVAVVVDLDALRHLRQSERGRHALQQAALGCGIAQLAAERLARIGQRACAISSFFSPRFGVETSTLKPALTESASASSAHSSISCDSKMSLGGGLSS